MSTLGTSYYVESPPVLPEQEDMRYPAAPAGVEQAMLAEYGGLESCPLQAKSSIFGGSWSHHPASSTSTPTYIHHHYTGGGGGGGVGGGGGDGMFARSWALDPVSASLCLTGLPSTAVHYEIKPEPVIGSAECTTLETHTPLLSDIGTDASLQPEAPCERTATTKAAEEERETDASKNRSDFLFCKHARFGGCGGMVLPWRVQKRACR